MNRIPSRLLTVVAALGLAACSETTDPGASTSASALLTDQQVTADVAVSAGAAIVDDLGEMVSPLSFQGLAPEPSFHLFGFPPGVSVTRTRTCFDANGVQQQACDPATTASMLLTMAMNGSFTRVADGPRGTDSMTAQLHRTRTLTISGLLGTETSRTHDGVGTADDTTRFKGVHQNVTIERLVEEAAVDSVQAVVFNLPHAANPFPVSGTIVRRVAGDITLTVNDSTATRTFSRRIEVTFPADGQGNVTMTVTVNGTTKTCLLNLVTRRVTGCE
jgi:hypothetical protein